MSKNAIPLAERLRPQTLDDLAGQQHLTGKGSILRTAIETGTIPSMILWVQIHLYSTNVEKTKNRSLYCYINAVGSKVIKHKNQHVSHAL